MVALTLRGGGSCLTAWLPLLAGTSGEGQVEHVVGPASQVFQVGKVETGGWKASSKNPAALIKRRAKVQ